MTRTCACGAKIHHRNPSGRCRRCATRLACQKRSIPDDFHIHAAVEGFQELMARYDCGTDAITRWRKESGVRRDPSTRPVWKLEIPAGFKLVAPTLTIRELRAKYGRSKEVVLRWCTEAGVKPRRVSPVRLVVGNQERRFGPVDRPHKDDSRAGRAADYLRRFGPVFRCDDAGRQDPKGKFWNRGGRTVLSDAELVGRALRNGWRPDAWMEVRVA